MTESPGKEILIKKMLGILVEDDGAGWEATERTEEVGAQEHRPPRPSRCQTGQISQKEVHVFWMPAKQFSGRYTGEEMGQWVTQAAKGPSMSTITREDGVGILYKDWGAKTSRAHQSLIITQPLQHADGLGPPDTIASSGRGLSRHR